MKFLKSSHISTIFKLNEGEINHSFRFSKGFSRFFNFSPKPRPRLARFFYFSPKPRPRPARFLKIAPKPRPRLARFFYCFPHPRPRLARFFYFSPKPTFFLFFPQAETSNFAFPKKRTKSEISNLMKNILDAKSGNILACFFHFWRNLDSFSKDFYKKSEIRGRGWGFSFFGNGFKALRLWGIFLGRGFSKRISAFPEVEWPERKHQPLTRFAGAPLTGELSPQDRNDQLSKSSLTGELSLKIGTTSYLKAPSRGSFPPKIGTTSYLKAPP